MRVSTAFKSHVEGANGTQIKGGFHDSNKFCCVIFQYRTYTWYFFLFKTFSWFWFSVCELHMILYNELSVVIPPKAIFSHQFQENLNNKPSKKIMIFKKMATTYQAHRHNQVSLSNKAIIVSFCLMITGLLLHLLWYVKHLLQLLVLLPYCADIIQCPN